MKKLNILNLFKYISVCLLASINLYSANIDCSRILQSIATVQEYDKFITLKNIASKYDQEVISNPKNAEKLKKEIIESIQEQVSKIGIHLESVSIDSQDPLTIVFKADFEKSSDKRMFLNFMVPLKDQHRFLGTNIKIIAEKNINTIQREFFEAQDKIIVNGSFQENELANFFIKNVQVTEEELSRPHYIYLPYYDKYIVADYQSSRKTEIGKNEFGEKIYEVSLYNEKERDQLLEIIELIVKVTPKHIPTWSSQINGIYVSLNHALRFKGKERYGIFFRNTLGVQAVSPTGFMQDEYLFSPEAALELTKIVHDKGLLNSKIKFEAIKRYLEGGFENIYKTRKKYVGILENHVPESRYTNISLDLFKSKDFLELIDSFTIELEMASRTAKFAMSMEVFFEKHIDELILENDRKVAENLVHVLTLTDINDYFVFYNSNDTKEQLHELFYRYVRVKYGIEQQSHDLPKHTKKYIYEYSKIFPLTNIAIEGLIELGRVSITSVIASKQRSVRSSNEKIIKNNLATLFASIHTKSEDYSKKTISKLTSRTRTRTRTTKQSTSKKVAQIPEKLQETHKRLVEYGEEKQFHEIMKFFKMKYSKAKYIAITKDFYHLISELGEDIEFAIINKLNGFKSNTLAQSILNELEIGIDNDNQYHFKAVTGLINFLKKNKLLTKADDYQQIIRKSIEHYLIDADPTFLMVKKQYIDHPELFEKLKAQLIDHLMEESKDLDKLNTLVEEMDHIIRTIVKHNPIPNTLEKKAVTDNSNTLTNRKKYKIGNKLYLHYGVSSKHQNYSDFKANVVYTRRDGNNNWNFMLSEKFLEQASGHTMTEHDLKIIMSKLTSGHGLEAKSLKTHKNIVEYIHKKNTDYRIFGCIKDNVHIIKLWQRGHDHIKHLDPHMCD